MLSSKVLRMVLAFVSLTCFAARARAQTTLHVDDDASPGGDGTTWATAYNSLSTALTVAQSGDQIWVAAGTYVGNFMLAFEVEIYGGFAGNETELSQRDWIANPTILDGNQTGSVVTSPTGATETTRLDGFTITNGSGTMSVSGTRGGGLYLEDSSPTIANNTIMGNAASYLGGGLYLDSSSPTIANNTITGNSARGGGGLHLRYYSSPTIENNTITGNSAYQGGGLYLYGDSSPTIVNNTITGNGASDGGGLYLRDSSPTIANNTITGNSAGLGGGLFLCGDSSPTIANTIVAFNSSGIRLFGTTDTPTLRYNCVYGNTHYDYAGLTDPTGTGGNISADPRLADPRYGNVHIQPDSPCVHAGSNADASGDFDVDGEPRIQPLGGTVDIGADESDGTVWSAGPYVIVRVSPAGDDANDGSSWSLAKRMVEAGIDAASVLGGEVWVQAGTYYERVTLHPYAYVYGGFSGGETAREQRDWDANVTTLDGQRRGSVVTARAGCEGVGAIDGFTITNGNAYSGGGLYLGSSSPKIANNTITGNSAVRYGGGLYLEWSSSPTIAKNTITGNSAVIGGGLLLRSSAPTIANNSIMGNEASYGGGLYLVYSSPVVGNNTITGNEAGYGGGLFLEQCSPRIANNAITGNSAAVGGAMYVNLGSPTIANTIVAFNSSGIHQDLVGTPTLQYNCVYGNTAYDYDGLSDPTGTAGNISADPVFVQNPDPGPDGLWGTADDNLGDLQLSSGSPCVDAGDNDGVPPDTPDLDGDSDTGEPLPLDLGGGPRFLDDPTSPDTGNPGMTGPPIVDIGAYEYVSPCGNGVVDPGEECDDGNVQPGDGCDATCHIEPEVIPTVSRWGLTVMALLLLSGLKVKFGQRRSAHA